MCGWEYIRYSKNACVEMSFLFEVSRIERTLPCGDSEVSSNCSLPIKGVFQE